MKVANLEVSQRDQDFIIAGLDLLGGKLEPKNRRYKAWELERANELQTLINRVVFLRYYDNPDKRRTWEHLKNANESESECIIF